MKKEVEKEIMLEDEITRYRDAYANPFLVFCSCGNIIPNGSLLSDTMFLSLPW